MCAVTPFTDLMITPAVAKVLSSGVVVATFSLPRDPYVSDAEWLRLASQGGATVQGAMLRGAP